jgi:hypothetical protein
MDSDDLNSVKGSIPSLVELGWTEMFDPSEERRLAAGRLRRSLRAAGVTDDPEAYKSAVWKFELPCEADLQKSECGRQTLELLKNSSLPKEVQVKPAGNVEPVAAAAPEVPPREPDDGVNPHLRRLAWPPKPQPPAKAPTIEDPPRDSIRPRYVAGRPSEPDKSLRPLPPDLGEQEPIY